MLAAAAAGKHLVIEKPAAISPDELRLMQKAVTRAGVETVVSFVLRWNPLFQQIKRHLASGDLGEVFAYAGGRRKGVTKHFNPLEEKWHEGTPLEYDGLEMAIWGNINAVSPLYNGSPAEIRKASEEALATVQSAGRKRFVLSSGCAVAPDTPGDNLKALIRVATGGE